MSTSNETIQCPECEGLGRVFNEEGHERTCERCQGNGTITRTIGEDYGNEKREEMD